MDRIIKQAAIISAQQTYKAILKIAQDPITTDNYAFQEWVNANFTAADKNKIAQAISDKLPEDVDLKSIRIDLAVNNKLLVVNAVVNGQPSSVAQKLVSDAFKSKGFKGANYPNGSKYDGWIVFPK
jgi:hypothetical protein